MLDPAHPTAILRLAWRRVRLAIIRGAVAEVIGELRELNRQDILPRPLELGGATHNPTAVAAAMLTCIDELREESGIASTAMGPCGASRPGDVSWQQCYSAALDRYRCVAGSSLTRRLAVV
jgi:hypothetical protein